MLHRLNYNPPVGLSIICYTREKRRKQLTRRLPVQGAHREVVILPIPPSKLQLEILKRVKRMRGVKLLVVLSVGTLYLSIMSWCVGTNLLVYNTKTL